MKNNGLMEHRMTLEDEVEEQTIEDNNGSNDDGQGEWTEVRNRKSPRKNVDFKTTRYGRIRKPKYMEMYVWSFHQLKRSSIRTCMRYMSYHEWEWMSNTM